MKESPYEYHNGKLGFKVKYLISDADRKAEGSLALISDRSMRWRLDAASSCEQRLRDARGKNRCALVEFSTLEPAWKKIIIQHFGEPQKVVSKNLFQQYYERNQDAFNFFAAYRYGDRNEKKLPPHIIELYTNNASVLDTLTKVRSEQKKLIKAHGNVRVDIWESLSNQVNAFRDVEHDLPARPGALRNKVAKYKGQNYAALVSGKYGLRNAAKVDNKEKHDLIANLLSRHQNLNNEQIAWWYNEFAKRLHGWEMIDAETIAKYRKEKALYTYAGQRGLREFSHKKAMLVKRKAPSAPMLYWSVDGLDVELLMQEEVIVKGKRKTVYHKRLTAVILLDAFNKYPMGFAIGRGETAELIKAATRDALRHTKELFGQYHKVHQLQSDNFGGEVARQAYMSACKHYTPAAVGNAKAKIVENWFDKFMENNFQKMLALNYSGHNVTARRENQPNAEYLDKVKKDFLDYTGVYNQIVSAINNERKEKLADFMAAWHQMDETYKETMSHADFLRNYGETTGYTNKLMPMGITPTINGVAMCYDSFDINFRKYGHIDWLVRYDPEDLSHVLVSNAKSKDGKFIEEVGTIEFMLEEKYVQPMALADRVEGDAEQLSKIMQYNEALKAHILEQSSERDQSLEAFIRSNPELDTLQKFLISDSTGSHKQLKQEAKELPQYIIGEDYYELEDDVRNQY